MHNPTVQLIATGLLELDAFNACTFHEIGKDSLAQFCHWRAPLFSLVAETFT